MFNFGRKPSPENLPGAKDSRVFIGGQYDFMPTLRAIERFVKEISTPEKTFHPVIPLDYQIEVEETMDRDLEILGRCKYAIFDLSDLGAQLVEMQEARQKQNAIRSLLVYPVRERRNEPERGRRTVLSFGLPHFGYFTLEELKGIVWRFLMDAPTEKDYPPRNIHDPVLDREIRRCRAFLGDGDIRRAGKVIESLLGQSKYRDSLEAQLLLALVECRKGDKKATQSALKRAEQLCGGNDDLSELHYYKSIIIRLESEKPDWSEVKQELLKAEQLRPNDGRILHLLGYVYWATGDLATAIEKAGKVLDDREIPDPVVAIQAANNLAYYLCQQREEGGGREENLDKALSLSQYLPAYQKVFRRRSGSWLDTRGWILTLHAQRFVNIGKKEDARQAIKEALDVLVEGEKLDRSNEALKRHLEEARAVESRIKALGNGTK